MDLIVTIPAHNEEKSLAEVISSIPQSITGFNKIQVIVIDDGSTDQTTQIALDAGAILISQLHKNGLAKTFQAGINEALKRGADVIVNIDADGQYLASEIAQLTRALIEQKADMVVGDRQVKKLNHMPFTKKYGNIIGSFFLRLTTGLKVNDASSGFRAFTRETALKTQILASHTYTHESLIQAAFWDLKVVNLPVTFNSRSHGESKLIAGVFSHIWKSLGAILRSLATYKPFSKFFTLGVLTILLAIIFTEFQLFPLVSFILFITGTMLVILGFIADLIVGNRRIQSEILYRIKKDTYSK